MWYENNYRRNLVDMHIEDWNPAFMSEFDSARYVEMLKTAKVKCAMVYANSHVGYCYWPTKTGHMHNGLNGRDVLGEIIDRCHREGMDVVVYFSLIFDNWAYGKNTDWRLVAKNNGPEGESQDMKPIGGRYGLCCPNAEGYREYIKMQLQDLCLKYRFEGFFFDMTYWPAVCYCPSCQKRYEKEIGCEIPEIVDWRSSAWLAFQKKREEWIAEFACFVTDTVKGMRPEITVEHQFATVTSPWTAGVTDALLKASDYASGDFYGGFVQQSLICKILYDMTPHMPFLYMTSRCYPNLHNHTTLKSEKLLEQQAYTAFAHNGAFMFIDAIDPKGTINPKTYEIMGEIFEKSSRYEQYFFGELCQDVGVYFSITSKMDLYSDAARVDKASRDTPHISALLGVVESLKEEHIPFGVTGRNNIGEIERHRVVILPYVLMMDDYEIAQFINYVNQGGSLYISGNPSSELLRKLLGISCVGYTKEEQTYISPVEKESNLLPHVTHEYPLSISRSQIIAEMVKNDGVMATITLPYTNPKDHCRFASIHSNPPGIFTNNPAIIYKQIGKGKVLWVSTPIECENTPLHRNVFANLISELADHVFSFKAVAPETVEVIMFHQKEFNRSIINLVNQQQQSNPIPVYNIKIRVKSDGKKINGVYLLPDNQPLSYTFMEDGIEVTLPRLDIFQMVAI